MAKSISTAAVAANNPHFDSIHAEETPLIVDGVVRHPLVSAGIQINILAIIDETSDASIGDIVSALSGHDDPLGAILALVAAGVLSIDFTDVLDEHSSVRRISRRLDPDGAIAPIPIMSDVISGSALERAELPAGIECLDASPFLTRVVAGTADQRRAFGRISLLQRPGIYGLLSATDIYIGMAERNVGERIAYGRQPIENVEKIFVFTDALGNLTKDDALVAERSLYSRACAMSGLTVINELPIGGYCDAEKFGWIDCFVAEGILALRNRGFHFLNGSPRTILAGPRAEPGRIGPMRRSDSLPEGDLLELHFDAGLVAHAARQSDDRWILLRGSHVRLEPAPSGNRGIHYTRSNWLHSGLISMAPDGRSFIVQQDLVFPNGSSTCQFCTGGKGRPLSAWKPFRNDRDDGTGFPTLNAA